MPPEGIVVGFSGHRKLANPKVVARGIRDVLKELVARHHPLTVICSVASGADVLFIEEAMRQGLSCRLILPFAQNRFKKDFKPADWQRALSLIKKATRVEQMFGHESTERSYLKTGIKIVESADVMVAVWDRKPATGVGGTGDATAYARELGKPLIIIDPASGNISEERLDRIPPKPSPIGSKRESSQNKPL